MTVMLEPNEGDGDEPPLRVAVSNLQWNSSPDRACVSALPAAVADLTSLGDSPLHEPDFITTNPSYEQNRTFTRS
jgi:hypothetical protein